MVAANPSTSDAAERLARLVQRLRRLVRGELILAGGHARLQSQDETDVATALELARELAVPVRFGAVTGGFPASSAGHADSSRCGLPGLQIDASAHLTRAARFDDTRGMIEVQPGVRLADLNRLLQPHGWWLPIETHPESGATLGGLVGLDAAAASPAWGTLADRLLGIDAILDDGTRQLFGPFGARSSVSLNSGRAGQLVSSLFGIAAGVQADIARHWPPGQRVPDGYLLDAFHPRPQRSYTSDGSVNLAHLLAGSAGTLAWSARLHLRLLRRPVASRWALFLQPSAVATLAHAPAVLALQPSAALLLDAADLRRLVGSRHPDDQALCRLAGVGQDVLGGLEGSLQKEARPAAWLVRFSGEADADVQAAHRRLTTLLEPRRQEGATGLSLQAGGGLQSHGRVAGGEGLPVWQALLGERVSPMVPPSALAIPLPPQDPATLAGLVTVLDERLALQGVQLSWRGQVTAGELQLVVPDGAGPLARQVLAATLPPRWTPALQQAFAEVRRQFDPTGILLGGR